MISQHKTWFFFECASIAVRVVVVVVAVVVVVVVVVEHLLVEVATEFLLVVKKLEKNVLSLYRDIEMEFWNLKP